MSGETQGVKVMQSYSRAESIEAGRVHETW